MFFKYMSQQLLKNIHLLGNYNFYYTEGNEIFS